MREGAFHVATRLYGLTFAERRDLPVYHPEVKAFEVKDADGSHLGVFYTDYHPRPGKRVGAWSSRFREQRIKDGKSIRPVVVNVCNFSRPTGDAPALLSLEEVETLFHEFGHALHSLLSQVPYRGLSGVPRDFVELPSQIMENWALEPDVLKVYAKHYQTGEVIPLALRRQDQEDRDVRPGVRDGRVPGGFVARHGLAHAAGGQAGDRPHRLRARRAGRHQDAPQIVVRYRSPYFSHVFGPGGGYAAGYYSYIWSEVLDADAFQAFKEKGLFDQATARAFRTTSWRRGTPRTRRRCTARSAAPTRASSRCW